MSSVGGFWVRGVRGTKTFFRAWVRGSEGLRTPNLRQPNPKTTFWFRAPLGRRVGDTKLGCHNTSENLRDVKYNEYCRYENKIRILSLAKRLENAEMNKLRFELGSTQAKAVRLEF